MVNKEIQRFWDEIFDIEVECTKLRRTKGKKEEHGKLAEKINSRFADYYNKETNEHRTFKLIVKYVDYSDEKYERIKNYPITRRRLFKITEYLNKEEGRLWACYMTYANPRNIYSIDECYVLKQDGASYKVILNFADDPGKWRNVEPNQEISHRKLGKVVQIERIVEPDDFRNSREHYWKDK